MNRLFLATGCVSGFLSVALGAFAAHGLKSRLDEYSMGVFRTGIDYQFYHTFALVLVGILVLFRPTPSFNWAGYAFIFGICVFSGSLYLLAFTGVKTWGAVTPIGGVGFLVGWILLLAGVLDITKSG